MRPSGRAVPAQGCLAPSEELIWEEWTTECNGQTDANGRLTFRGFHGRYQVRLQHDGTERAFEIHVQKGAENKFTLGLD